MKKIFGSFVVCSVLFLCLGGTVNASGFYDTIQNIMGLAIDGGGYPDTQAICTNPHTLEVYGSCKYVSAAGREYYIKYISWSNDNKAVIEVNGVTYVKSIGGFITLEYADSQSEQLTVIGMSSDEYPKLTISFSGANGATGEYGQFSSNSIVVYGAYASAQDYTYCLGELKAKWPDHVVKQDNEVTAADKETKNLILLSGPAGNRLVADLASAGKTPTVAEWMEAYQDRYIVQIVEDAYASGKDVLIIAGWDVEQSKNACNHFLENKPPTVIDENEKCTDSDGGRNYYVKGTAGTDNKMYTDYCQDSYYLFEYDCGISGGVPEQDECSHSDLGGCRYKCPNGCNNGVCVKAVGNSCDLPGTALDTKSECEAAGCDWLTSTHGCGNTGAWSIENCGYELHDYECSIKASWSQKWDGAVSECYNCDCSWCCCPGYDNDHTTEKCVIGRYNCEKDSFGKDTGWSQKCYDESKGWVNVVYCSNGCDGLTGQCNSKEEDSGVCGDGVCDDEEAPNSCSKDCAAYEEVFDQERCETWHAPNVFNYAPCGNTKVYDVVAQEKLRISAYADGCANCVCYHVNFDLYDYIDGRWIKIKSVDEPDVKGTRNIFDYVPRGNKIKIVGTSGCFHLNVYRERGIECEVGEYRCEKDSSGRDTGWSQKCYDESKGWVNVVYCSNGCDGLTGQCNSKEEDSGVCGDGVCVDKEEGVCPQDCMQVYPSGSDVEYCTASGGKRYPTSGEGAATWFLWGGCSRYKEYDVVPGKELRFLIIGDSCAGCVCYTPNFKIYEYDESGGSWVMKKEYSSRGYRGYRDNLYYVSQSSKIKVEASRCFYLRVYYRYKQDFPSVCGDGVCAYGEDVASCPKDCANFRCIGEGESIPAISNRFQCCGSLKLIKPRSRSVTGSSGICTAECGNGLCDSDVETDYNCPEDCKAMDVSCTDSDGGVEIYVKGKVIDKGHSGTFDNYDKCLSENRILEYSCKNDAWYANYRDCPNGCMNGACLRSATSSRCPVITCKLYCKNGFKTDERGCHICACRDEVVRNASMICSGCGVESGCVVQGTRLKHEGKPSYCSLARKMEVQKSEGIHCQNNYECMSNFCSDDSCVDINRKVERNRDVIEKIMDFLGKLFSI